MTDEPIEPIEEDAAEDNEDDGFFITGHATIQAGMTETGELQWRWKNNDIELALLLGFLVVMQDEIKDDIRAAIENTDEDD